MCPHLAFFWDSPYPNQSCCIKLLPLAFLSWRHTAIGGQEAYEHEIYEFNSVLNNQEISYIMTFWTMIKVKQKAKGYPAPKIQTLEDLRDPLPQFSVRFPCCLLHSKGKNPTWSKTKTAYNK